MPAFVRDLRLYVNGTEAAQGCHMHLFAQDRLSLLPGTQALQIYDLSDSTAALLAGSPFLEVRCDDSVLASGRVSTVITRPDGGQCCTQVDFSSDEAFRTAPVSLTVASGMTASATIRCLLSSSGTEVPLAAFTAKDMCFLRPQSFFGRACDAITTLADTVGADAFLSPAGLCVVSRSPGAASLILPENMLLSEPVPVRDRVILSTVMVGWPMGSAVEYRWNGVKKTGRLVSRMIEADNDAGPWKSYLELEV